MLPSILVSDMMLILIKKCHKKIDKNSQRQVCPQVVWDQVYLWSCRCPRVTHLCISLMILPNSRFFLTISLPKSWLAVGNLGGTWFFFSHGFEVLCIYITTASDLAQGWEADILFEIILRVCLSKYWCLGNLAVTSSREMCPYVHVIKE